MKVIVVGCGKIGKAIIDSLTEEGHDVTAMDLDMQVVESVATSYDVMAVCGSATSREMLLSAGAPDADLFVAVTESDEINMLSCFVAKKMGARYTVARIRQSDYNDSGLDYLIKELDLSMALNPESMTAEALFNLLKMPSTIGVETFAGKRLQIMEFIIKEKSPLDGATLADIRSKSSVPFLACVVQRGDEVCVPTGSYKLRGGDKIAFMVRVSEAHKFLKAMQVVQRQAKDVILLGASNTAYYLAKMLLANNFSVKIIEMDEHRCTEVAEKLSHATMICGDGTNLDLLLEEGIKSTAAFVALTGKDEDNILMSFYAMNEHVPQVISKVSHTELATLAGKLGLDCIVTSQKIVADVITRYARALRSSLGNKVETRYALADDKAEALEFSVLADCALSDVPLKNLKLKPNYIIAGIIRGNETIIPSGSDVIMTGDKVIVVAVGSRLFDLSEILR